MIQEMNHYPFLPGCQLRKYSVNKSDTIDYDNENLASYNVTK